MKNDTGETLVGQTTSTLSNSQSQNLNVKWNWYICFRAKLSIDMLVVKFLTRRFYTGQQVANLAVLFAAWSTDLDRRR